MSTPLTLAESMWRRAHDTLQASRAASDAADSAVAAAGAMWLARMPGAASRYDVVCVARLAASDAEREAVRVERAAWAVLQMAAPPAIRCAAL